MADSAASAPDHPDRGGHSLYRIGVRRLAALRRRRLERIGPVPVHGRGLVRAPSSRRRKGRPGNQIAAFYTDLATYVAWYHSPATNRHIPDDMPLGEFVFVMHHGGRGGPVLFKDTARDLYRKHVTDDTRLLTAAHPSPAPARSCSTPRPTPAIRWRVTARDASRWARMAWRISTTSWNPCCRERNGAESSNGIPTERSAFLANEGPQSRTGHDAAPIKRRLARVIDRISRINQKIEIHIDYSSIAC